MTGLDKMVNQILDEANNSASTILDNAKAQADEILAKAKADAGKSGEEISKRSKADIANYRDRMNSSADLKRRTAVLEAKQGIITQVIEKAYDTFCSKSDAEYFQTIEEMLGKFALPQKGEIYFSSKDISRMPSGFEGKIQEIAKKNGGSLTLSKDTREIPGGFVLAYGGIEENCSFEALFDSKRDELQDKVQKLLFS